MLQQWWAGSRNSWILHILYMTPWKSWQTHIPWNISLKFSLVFFSFSPTDFFHVPPFPPYQLWQLTWVLGHMRVKYLINALGLPAMIQRDLQTEKLTSIEAVYSIFIPLHTRGRYEVNWLYLSHSSLLFISKCIWGQSQLSHHNHGMGMKVKEKSSPPTLQWK